MQRQTPLAGGFFLIIAIFAGFAIGVSRGQAMIGTVAGTLVGTLIALGVWWADRRRDAG